MGWCRIDPVPATEGREAFCGVPNNMALPGSVMLVLPLAGCSV